MFRSEGFQKYLRNTSWLFVDRVVRLLAVLLTSMVVTRALGPELFGQFNYSSAFVGIFFALTSMGLEDIISRDMVRHPERRDKLLGTAAAMKFGGSIVLFIASLLMAWLTNVSPIKLMMVALIASAEFLKPFTVVEPYFHSQTKGRLVAQVNMFQAIVSSLFRIAVVLLVKDPHQALIPLAMSYIVEMTALSGGYYVAYHRQGLRWRDWRFDREIARELLQQSWPLIVYGLALYVQAKIDQVLIGNMLVSRLGAAGADAEVGQYSAALKMIEALGFVPSIVQASLAPAITRAKAQSRALYEERLVNQYRLMFILFLSVSIPLYFLAPWGMRLLFGDKYAEAGVLLSLFAIRLFFTNMGVAKTSFITNESLFKYSLVTSVVGAALNIWLNLLLIPTLYSRGAILAMIVSFAVSIFFMDLLFKAARPNFFWMMRGIFSFWKVHRAT